MALIREFRNGQCVLYGNQILAPIGYAHGFVVDVDRYSFDAGVSRREFGAILAWCGQTFPPDRWLEGDDTVWLKDVDDAMHFKLRWM